MGDKIKCYILTEEDKADLIQFMKSRAYSSAVSLLRQLKELDIPKEDLEGWKKEN